MKIIKVVSDDNRKVGLLKFRNRDAFLSSWWGNDMSFAEASKEFKEIVRDIKQI